MVLQSDKTPARRLCANARRSHHQPDQEHYTRRRETQPSSRRPDRLLSRETNPEL